jgi:hypothetical protein
MTHKDASMGFSRALTFGFMAGFFSTLIFHQGLLALLRGIGLAPFGPFVMTATQPFGVPAVFSLAFWGGIWGIPLAMVHSRFPHRGYWLTAFLFGAVLPSLVALMVVMPLKGRPLGGGWHPPFLATAFMINGIWSIGTALILKSLSRWTSKPQ